VDPAQPGRPGDGDALLIIDEALRRIAGTSPRQARVAELKLFAGLEIAEIALAVGVSEATVKRDWADAKQVFGDALRT
jgi:DNA-directed RNA polymerase specialized sigma24 family protein